VKQKTMAKLMYRLTMRRSRKMIVAQLGNEFWNRFSKNSNLKMEELMQGFEDIGRSMFSTNYIYAPGYVAWYTSMEAEGLSRHECDVLMLKMNEKMLKTVPSFLMHAVGKSYYRNMSKEAALRVANRPEKLHPFDWVIDYRNIDNDNFEIDIKSCGFIEYAKKYGGVNMLPAICQVDYLISNLMGVGFERSQTLGAGGCMCDCKYSMNGTCEWDIEKRLSENK